MSTTTLATPELVGPGKHVQRDRWGRPLITPPRGGKPVPYTRCTTYVDVLESTWNLMAWKQRMTAIGLAQRDDLRLQVLGAIDDKTRLNKIVEEAANHAGASASATIGTELHAWSERLDRGETLPPLGDPWQGDIDAYHATTRNAGLDPVELETFVVNDALRIGGTFDRIYQIGNQKYIGDLKTGSLDWGAGKFAMQLAVYANSERYDVQTGQRTPLDVNTGRAIIVHLPKGENKCTLYWIDIARGWQMVGLAQHVREYRQIPAKEWLNPFTPTATAAEKTSEPTIPEYIQAAATISELADVYRAYQDQWTPELNQLAATRRKQIEENPFLAQPARNTNQ